MILTVDIGNSRIKWATWQEHRILARGVAGYDSDASGEVFDRLFAALGEAPAEAPSAIYAVCVAGEAIARVLDDWVRRRWQLGVEYLQTQKQFADITNAYPDPEQHGADRWAVVVAGHQAYPGHSVCVIGAGTAITVDLVNKDGRHLGGYILPSFASMYSALLADTANIKPRYDQQLDQQGIPDNTRDAVNQGLHKLLQAGIREMCQLAEDRMEAPVRVVLTGGFASTILDYPEMPIMHHKPDLVMQGLYSIMQQNKKNTGQ